MWKDATDIRNYENAGQIIKIVFLFLSLKTK